MMAFQKVDYTSDNFTNKFIRFSLPVMANNQNSLSGIHQGLITIPRGSIGYIKKCTGMHMQVVLEKNFEIRPNEHYSLSQYPVVIDLFHSQLSKIEIDL